MALAKTHLIKNYNNLLRTVPIYLMYKPRYHFKPKVGVVSICEKMVYTCVLKTYDARRAPGEAQQSARRALLLRKLLRS